MSKYGAKVSALNLVMPPQHDGIDEDLEMELHTTSAQMWCEGCVGGLHFGYGPTSTGRSYDPPFVKMPHGDAVYRQLVTIAATQQRTLVGEFLRPILDSMEAAIAERDGSSVYFADAGGQIKIGWSKKVSARLAQLQTGSAVPIKLLGTMPGGLAVERRIHQQFAHLRLSGEWFTAAPELLDFVAGRARLASGETT